MKANTAVILSQIKSLEAQLAALKAQVERLSAQEAKPTHTVAERYGRYPEFVDLSAENIDAALYQLAGDLEEPK